jgi:response regulator of citrate/malate metabolism
MSLSVLIIEDEFITAEDIRAALVIKQHTIFGIARSFEQAIQLLQKGKPDVALVDITLGKRQSGLLLGKLLSEELQIPYFYITAHSDISTLRKVKLTNPNGFIVKPFKRESIYALLQQLSSTKNIPSKPIHVKCFILSLIERIKYWYKYTSSFLEKALESIANRLFLIDQKR